MKKNVLTCMLAMMMLMMLMSCGAETASIVAKKAIEVYAQSYIDDVPDEQTRQLLVDNKEDLAVKALANYLNEPELQGLGQSDKVKQAVLLAIDQIVGENAGA